MVEEETSHTKASSDGSDVFLFAYHTANENHANTNTSYIMHLGTHHTVNLQ